MYKSSIILCVCLLLTGCKKHASVQNNESDSVYSVTQEGQDLFEIDIKDCVKDAVEGEDIYMSQFFESMEYIPLETTNESLIGNGRFVSLGHLVSDKIIIVDMKIFDRKTGKYLSALSSRGQGPKEYLEVFSTAADDEREEIYFYSGAKIQVFGYDNTYKKTIKYADEPSVFSLGNGNLLLARGIFMNCTYDDYCVLNVDSNEILYTRRSSALLNCKDLNECKHLVKRGESYASMGANMFWEYDDGVRYYDYLTDTVYAINKKFEAVPIGHINFEDLKQTKEELYIGSKGDFLYWRLLDIAESPQFLYIYITACNQERKERKYYMIVYKKDTKEIKTYYGRDGFSIHNPIHNDIDNGVTGLFLDRDQGGHLGYRIFSSESIKENADENGKKIYNPLLYDKYVKMAESLKDDDNGVVSIVTLK